jgi:nucleotide-binding universal stress UspA family protein
MLGSTLLTALKEELGFWEKGGYGYKFRSAWRPTLVLRDSPICFNAMAADARSCRECLLADLVPPEKRNLSLPCHHIPLNQAGDTIAGLYINGTQDKLDQTFLGWLRSTIEKLEESEVSAMKALECTTAISFKNILFLTDFSPASEAAYTYAVALARHFGARVYPAHALAPFVPTEMEVPISPEIFAQAEEQGLQKLIDLFEPAKVPYEPLVTQGLVEIVVQDWIKEHGIDLIVMARTAEKALTASFWDQQLKLSSARCPAQCLRWGHMRVPSPSTSWTFTRCCWQSA